jgi:hypothetical protein
MRWGRGSTLGALLVLCALLGESGAEPPAALDGTWEGMWRSGTTSGGLTLHLRQSGQTVLGTYDADSGPAGTLRGLPLKGTLEGNALVLKGYGRILFEGLVADGSISGTFRGSRSHKDFFVRRK